MAETRKVRGYKVTDKVYNKAMRRAKKEKGFLSNLIESAITAYADGYNIVRTDGNGDSVVVTVTK